MVGPTEDELEQWVLEILTELGWTHVYGPDIAPGEPGAEREVHAADDWHTLRHVVVANNRASVWLRDGASLIGRDLLQAHEGPLRHRVPPESQAPRARSPGVLHGP